MLASSRATRLHYSSNKCNLINHKHSSHINFHGFSGFRLVGTSQKLGTGCPELAILGTADRYILITTTNLYLLIVEKWHNILIQYHMNYIKVQNCSYMLEKDVLRNTSQKEWGGIFLGFGCPNDAQTSCWLRLCTCYSMLANLPLQFCIRKLWVKLPCVRVKSNPFNLEPY